jgi:phage shock protein C
MTKRLMRSRSDRMLAGVCGGLAEYIQIDAVWIRIFFILLSMGDGVGILIYAVLWILLPNSDNPDQSMGFKAGDFSQRIEDMGRDINQATSHPHPNTVKFVGFGLIVVGLFYLLKILNLPWLLWFNRELLFPIVLILAGGALLFRAIRK